MWEGSLTPSHPQPQEQNQIQRSNFWSNLIADLLAPGSKFSIDGGSAEDWSSYNIEVKTALNAPG